MNTTTNGDPRADQLIRKLRGIARDVDIRSDARRTMAELRRGLRDDPRDRLRVLKVVAPILGPPPEERWKIESEEWFYIVAALYASHPEYERDVSLGEAFRRMAADSDSVEQRFMSLLSARPEPDRMRPLLRQAVALLSVNRRPVPLDWLMLLNDLLLLKNFERDVKQRWARDFYSTFEDNTTDLMEIKKDED